MSQGPASLRECSSPSMCHMSCVTCHISSVKYLFFSLCCGACWQKVCYQLGLPRLDLFVMVIYRVFVHLSVFIFTTEFAHINNTKYIKIHICIWPTNIRQNLFPLYLYQANNFPRICLHLYLRKIIYKYIHNCNCQKSKSAI